ncbi:hypothetical protein F5Y06DRAFT_235165 [Hypoxylon sp. FL0890]|nr:hypothetical protein F5Y06DRAFT_235165 [Hypoxylon sp. FL0890]
MMLRHSISQVFGSKHPALSPRGDDDIGPRQPFDTKNFALRSHKQHQIHHSANSSFPPLNPLLEISHYRELTPMPVLTPTPAPAIQPMPLLSHMPRNAAAAVPSSSTPLTRSQVVPRDASSLHPVFFTERLRRTPFIHDAVGVTSPVAHGYAYQEVQRRANGIIPAML